MLLFDRTKLGCVKRREFFYALAAHVVFDVLVFVVPFEMAYRLQVAPTGTFMLLFINGWLLMQWPIVLCLFRLTGRRLRDAGVSPLWRFLWLVPVVGWGVLIVMLLLPSDHCSENWIDRYL